LSPLFLNVHKNKLIQNEGSNITPYIPNNLSSENNSRIAVRTEKPAIIGLEGREKSDEDLTRVLVVGASVNLQDLNESKLGHGPGCAYRVGQQLIIAIILITLAEGRVG